MGECCTDTGTECRKGGWPSTSDTRCRHYVTIHGKPAPLPSSDKPSDAELVNDLRNKIAKAMGIVHALCQPRGSEGARSWRMSIPARPDYDPDIIICDALIAAERLAAARLSVREGWAMVPVELTPEMVEAAQYADEHWRSIDGRVASHRERWKAMLDALPKSPA